MQDTSGITNYDAIVSAGNYSVETKLVINDTDFTEGQLYSVKTTRQLFTSQNPTVGNAVVGRLDATITIPMATIPLAAEVKPYIRVFNNSLTSGWLQKGVFYFYQRWIDEDNGTITFVAFDAMFRGNQAYPSSALQWDNTHPYAWQVVDEILGFMDVTAEADTLALLRASNYIVQFPAQYSLRDVLGSIAAMYGGNFIITNEGLMRFVAFADLAGETYYLVTNAGSPITFGGTKILIRG